MVRLSCHAGLQLDVPKRRWVGCELRAQCHFRATQDGSCSEAHDASCAKRRTGLQKTEELGRERERGSSEQKRVRENVAQIRGSWVRRTSWEKGCLSEKVPQWRSSSFIIASSSTAQGGGGSFKNRKPIGEVGCCESGMAKRIHWWTERCLRSPLCLSLSLTIYLPIYLSSVYLSLSLAIYLSLSLFHLVTYLPIYLPII